MRSRVKSKSTKHGLLHWGKRTDVQAPARDGDVAIRKLRIPYTGEVSANLVRRALRKRMAPHYFALVFEPNVVSIDREGSAVVVEIKHTVLAGE